MERFQMPASAADHSDVREFKKWMVTTRSGSKSSSSTIKLPVVGSVSYVAAAVGAFVIYYLWRRNVDQEQNLWTVGVVSLLLLDPFGMFG